MFLQDASSGLVQAGVQKMHKPSFVFSRNNLHACCYPSLPNTLVRHVHPLPNKCLYAHGKINWPLRPYSCAKCLVDGKPMHAKRSRPISHRPCAGSHCTVQLLRKVGNRWTAGLEQPGVLNGGADHVSQPPAGLSPRLHTKSTSEIASTPVRKENRRAYSRL